ncbi:MAG TPA: SGNH/GDSL hydrolase family protein [Vicinamibacterales bacterium]|nr:SGNH/GDSL hydrolase family protein [Vicinamibacterales bacterium]
MTPSLRNPWLHTSPAGLLLTLCLVVLTAACGSKGEDDDGGPGPSPMPNTVRYTAIGASDAIGFGSSVPCVPFDTVCANGRGYVAIIARTLRSSGKEVILSNLGVPGQVLGPEIQQIGNTYGRGIPGNFLQQQMPFVRSGVTLVTIFAGGNDTNAVATAIDRGAAGSNVNAYIDARVQTFAADYQTLVRGVRERAGGSPRIIVLNLPNFAGLPYTQKFTSTQRRWMQRISVGFSRAANALRDQGVHVVDLLCDARSYQPGNYSSDGFHPDDSGYEFIAEKVLQAIGTDPPPPPNDCSFARIGQ